MFAEPNSVYPKMRSRVVNGGSFAGLFLSCARKANNFNYFPIGSLSGIRARRFAFPPR